MVIDSSLQDLLHRKIRSLAIPNKNYVKIEFEYQKMGLSIKMNCLQLPTVHADPSGIRRS
jgi:hypothetical protein